MIGDKKYRRNGFGAEALRAAEKISKDRLDWSVLVAKINKNNKASIKFFKKNGFVKTGTQDEEEIFKKQL